MNRTQLIVVALLALGGLAYLIVAHPPMRSSGGKNKLGGKDAVSERGTGAPGSEGALQTSPGGTQVAGAHSVLQKWPAPDAIPWKRDSYVIIPGQTRAVIGFAHGGHTLYAFRSQLRPAFCEKGPGSVIGDCVRLPNRQLVEVTPALADEVPILPLLKERMKRVALRPPLPAPRPAQK